MLTPSTLTLAQTQKGTVVVSTSVLSGAAQVLQMYVDKEDPGSKPFGHHGPNNQGWNTYDGDYRKWFWDWEPRLPPGCKAFFSPPAIKAGESTLLTIDTGNMDVGTYTINITACGDVVTHTVQLTLVVTASDFSI